MIRQLLYRFQKENFKKTLGRWCTEQDNSKIVHRFDWANEDHCGACGNSFHNISQRENDNFIIDKVNPNDDSKNI